jgi:hypothetical protein
MTIRKNRPHSSSKRPHSPLAAYVIGVLLIALGFAIYVVAPSGYESFKVQSQAENWPRAKGTVVSSVVDVDKVTPHDQHQKQDMYRPLVKTRYRVDGRDYVINEIYVGQTSGWTSRSGSVRKTVARYAPGIEVDVYYSPEDPAIGVLETSVELGTYILLVLSIAIALLGVLFLYVGIRDTYRFIAYYVVFFRNKRRSRNS